MTKVNCSVEDCSYNKNRLCYAGEILVSEQGTEEVTCCGSFIHKETYKNIIDCIHHEKPTQYVKCKVGSCRHYKHENCLKAAIEIRGKLPTHIYLETYCNHYESR